MESLHVQRLLDSQKCRRCPLRHNQLERYRKSKSFPKAIIGPVKCVIDKYSELCLSHHYPCISTIHGYYVFNCVFHKKKPFYIGILSLTIIDFPSLFGMLKMIGLEPFLAISPLMILSFTIMLL